MEERCGKRYMGTVGIVGRPFAIVHPGGDHNIVLQPSQDKSNAPHPTIHYQEHRTDSYTLAGLLLK